MNLAEAAAIAKRHAKPVAPRFPLADGEARMVKLRDGSWCCRIASMEDLGGQHVDVSMADGSKRRVRLTTVRFPATPDRPQAVWDFAQRSGEVRAA